MRHVAVQETFRMERNRMKSKTTWSSSQSLLPASCAQRGRVCAPWLVMCAASLALETSAVAGPHHWQVWKRGTVRSVDAAQKEFTVQPGMQPEPLVVHWDQQTCPG